MIAVETTKLHKVEPFARIEYGKISMVYDMSSGEYATKQITGHADDAMPTSPNVDEKASEEFKENYKT
jgi:hypothetical protein